MNAQLATPLATRLGFAALAIVASSIALGSTVAGFQPAADSTLVVMERVTVTASAIN